MYDVFAAPRIASYCNDFKTLHQLSKYVEKPTSVVVYDDSCYINVFNSYAVSTV